MNFNQGITSKVLIVSDLTLNLRDGMKNHCVEEFNAFRRACPPVAECAFSIFFKLSSEDASASSSSASLVSSSHPTNQKQYLAIAGMLNLNNNNLDLKVRVAALDEQGQYTEQYFGPDESQSQIVSGSAHNPQPVPSSANSRQYNVKRFIPDPRMTELLLLDHCGNPGLEAALKSTIAAKLLTQFILKTTFHFSGVLLPIDSRVESLQVESFVKLSQHPCQFVSVFQQDTDKRYSVTIGGDESALQKSQAFEQEREKQNALDRPQILDTTPEIQHLVSNQSAPQVFAGISSFVRNGLQGAQNIFGQFAKQLKG